MFLMAVSYCNSAESASAKLSWLPVAVSASASFRLSVAVCSAASRGAVSAGTKKGLAGMASCTAVPCVTFSLRFNLFKYSATMVLLIFFILFFFNFYDYKINGLMAGDVIFPQLKITFVRNYFFQNRFSEGKIFFTGKK